MFLKYFLPSNLSLTADLSEKLKADVFTLKHPLVNFDKDGINKNHV